MFKRIAIFSLTFVNFAPKNKSDTLELNFFISLKTKEGDKVTKHAIEIESRARKKCKIAQKG